MAYAYSKHNSTKELCSRPSQNNITSRAPQSPGISANQNLKDQALDLIFQKKIKDLKSKLNALNIWCCCSLTGCYGSWKTCNTCNTDKYGFCTKAW